VNPVSAAKIGGILGVLLGLVIGAFASLWMMAMGSMVGGMTDRAAVPFAGMIGGAAAIVIVPICYGLFTFIGTLIYAALYNLAAKWVGGIEIEAA
jgi:hypothetical protein